jgi:uncharacterized membrane protein YphA (DoxX/SURF4 family)
MYPEWIIFLHIFIRLLLGLILLSTGLSKLMHPSRFRQAIQNYRLVPAAWEAKLSFSMVVAFVIPIAELIAGLGIIGGFELIPAALLAFALFVLLSVALIINLMHGRYELSCHCEGMLGNHRISWWLVGRNGLFLGSLLALLLTPDDMFTIGELLRSPSLFTEGIALSILLPVVLLVGVVLAAIILFNSARTL